MLAAARGVDQIDTPGSGIVDTVSVNTDGALLPALDRLYAAVGGLVDDLKQLHHDGTMLVGPSWYGQLVESVGAPSCGATHVYRRDSAGENVRQPALQIIAHQGCTCLACWTPDRYLFLCKLLGFALPAGVLE